MSSGDVKVFKASDNLSKKAGTGSVDIQKLAASEKVMEETGFDFVSFAKDNLVTLREEISKAKQETNINKEELVEALTAPVMQLKSSAATYGYDLVGELTNIMLGFLERVDQADDKVLGIIDAHQTTIFAILSNNMKGDGGEQGAMLKQELQDVCKKYLSRQNP